MFRGHRIAVVVPAYNEAVNIERAVRSVPAFVDHVFVVDDASADGTGAIASRLERRGLEILRNGENRGVGAAIAAGYARARSLGADVTAVMAGDAQMDPADLPTVLEPVTAGRADYVKGNRFLWPGGWRAMPVTRLLGNLTLSLLTRVASGYAHLFDSQCGYTACNRFALETIVAGPVFARYGYPNDLLVRLAAAGARVEDVAVRPVYGPGWRSGLCVTKVVGPIALVLARGLSQRLARAAARAAKRLPTGAGARTLPPVAIESLGRPDALSPEP